ncbi:hypothetical protein BG015_005871 [Linnemannia schmuckeri]|uniref:Kelch repeat-containing protein n=1 Tax=Linnemannia schmuckeri TaxID=64567 RepID=A0A9P5S0J6_9FUNG|nr:hypothetical protein BG015_005871 [Linnemannia schmuckeri]
MQRPTTTPRRQRTPFFLQLACLPFEWLTILLVFASITRAQTYIPTPVYDMAFASRINKALIIHGGKAQMNPDATNNQLFALDLTVPLWEASSPPWRYLTAPTASQSPRFLDRNTMVMSSDETKILLFDRNFPYLATYNVTSDSWLDKQNLPLSFAYGSNYTTAMDPASDVVFLGRGGANGTMMMVYNSTSHDSWTQPMPVSTQLPTYVQGYSFVYCPSRKSILLFGGKSFSYQGDVYNPYVFEFQMGAYSWIRLNTEGPSPTQIYSHCMVPAYDGFKMVVFGGSVRDDTQLGDIYILDVPTMTWSKGSASPMPFNRSNMACTVGGDNFVAWGGYNAQKSIDGTPIIYNLRTNQWTTTYSLIPAESKYNWGAIIGGIVAVIVVAAGFGFIYYRRKKQRESLGTRTDVQTTGDPKRQQHHLHQEQGNQDSKQRQQQEQQEPDTYYQQTHNGGAGPSVEHGSTYKGSLQHRLINGGPMSSSMTSITPLFARNNSAQFSLNSGSSSIQQPPVELYEKGYYVPESSRRNPQYFGAAAAIPYDESGMVPVDLSSAESPWMTPQSSRRNPQLVSSQQHHHSPKRSRSVASNGTLVDDNERKGDAEREAPVYHEACSSFSDARTGRGGNKEGGITQEEATTTSTAAILADLNNTYHSPLQSAIYPISTSSNIMSDTLVASGSQILDMNRSNDNESTDYINGEDIKDEQTLQQEMAMIHAQQAEYQQNLEWLRLESERLEQERLAYLERLARLQNQQSL